MSNEVEALGRALHHAGVNLDRTTLGVAVRELEKRGYGIRPISGQVSNPQFHVQPAPGADASAANMAQRHKASEKEGPGRV